MKKTIIAVIVVAVLAGLGWYFWSSSRQTNITNDQQPPATTTPAATTTPPAATTTPAASRPETIIGESVDGNDITAYHFGTGDKELLFIGGIHGGYSWNTVLVAQELVDYLKARPETVPAGVKVTVIPLLNPDGLKKVTGDVVTDFTAADVSTSQNVLVSGRFNGRNVDLNRNFDCEWQASGVWQSRTVSGGSAAFSEPETRALRDYVSKNEPAAVVAWYSSAGGVYASSCGKGILAGTRAALDTYAAASGYPKYDNFDAYKVTGDMVNWFAKKDIPAISVLLTNHQDTEWSKNLAGIKALLEDFAD